MTTLRDLAETALRQGPSACVALTYGAARELLALLDAAERLGIGAPRPVPPQGRAGRLTKEDAI